MKIEIARLILGLAIVGLHRQIADFILARERELAGFFRERGVLLPALPSTGFAHNLYFGIGVFVSLVSLGRIWEIF